MKSFEKLEKALELLFDEKAINKTNPKGISHANSLIASGDINKPSSWERPSVEMENAYIDENGWDEFGKWFWELIHLWTKKLKDIMVISILLILKQLIGKVYEQLDKGQHKMD